MSSKTTIIVSDLHLGSKYALASPFLKFIKTMPLDATLVLNGDTIDRHHVTLPPEHAEVLDSLREESHRRPVKWIYGNHDNMYSMKDPGKIDFIDSYAIDDRIFIAHGHYFDNISPYNRWFIILFKTIHETMVRLGAEPMHVAQFAKKFPSLYRILRRHVMLNAVEHARENGFAAVACGHTHFTEDITRGEIRYLNSGSWTERPLFCISVNPSGIQLLPVSD